MVGVRKSQPSFGLRVRVRVEIKMREKNCVGGGKMPIESEHFLTNEVQIRGCKI